MDQILATETLIEDLRFRESVTKATLTRVRKDNTIPFEDRWRLFTTAGLGQERSIWSPWESLRPFISNRQGINAAAEQIFNLMTQRIGIFGSRVAVNTVMNSIEQFMPSVLIPAATLRSGMDTTFGDTHYQAFKEELLIMNISYLNITPRATQQ